MILSLRQLEKRIESKKEFVCDESCFECKFDDCIIPYGVNPKKSILHKESGKGIYTHKQRAL